MKLNSTLQRATLGFTGTLHVELRVETESQWLRWCLPGATLSNGAQIECEYLSNINEDEFGESMPVVRCWMYNGMHDIYHDIPVPHDEFGLLAFAVDVPYSFTVQQPYDVLASVDSITGTEGGQLWRAWTIAPDPNWLLDCKLKIWYSCPESQVAIVNAVIGDTTGEEYTWAAAAGAILNLGSLWVEILAGPGETTGGTWGPVATASFVRTGLAPVNFGTHNYTISGDTVISLIGDTVTAYAPDSQLTYAYAYAAVYAGSFSTECTGEVKYVDGLPITAAKLNLPENVRVHNGTTWGSGSIGTELDHDGGAALNYSGYWELRGLEQFSGTIVGDYLVTTQNPLDIRAVCRDCDVGYDNSGDLRRGHGPLTVKDVAGLGQPDYVGDSDESYSDCRVLLEHNDAAVTITGALSVAVDASSRKVVDWAYGDAFRTSGVTPSNVDGKPAFHVDSAGAYIECDYSAVKEADAWAAHWLLVRYADIRLVGATPTGDFTVTIAGRDYACSIAKPRVDLMAFTGDPVSPTTQSLLPTFLPERTKKTGGVDDGDPDPPVVTDIPKDWGIYLPGVIRFSGLTIGETYILDNITLQRLTDPITVILPEPNWTGWHPDSTRSPESDPPAFDDCGIGGTTAIPCHVWAQQIGWVIVDGARLEIVGSLFRLNGLETQTWDVRYPMFDETGRPQYWAFPHAVSPFLTITQGGTRPSGCGWQTGEDVPLDYLVPGKHEGACSIDAKLRIVQYDLPANYPSVPINFSKDYGCGALIVVANPERLTVACTLNLSTGCTGNFSKASDITGSCLLWGSTGATEMLSQWNGSYTRHECTAEVTDGDEGTVTGEVRNRAIWFALVRSAKAAETATGLPLASANMRGARTYRAHSEDGAIKLGVYDHAAAANVVRTAKTLTGVLTGLGLAVVAGRINKLALAWDQAGTIYRSESVDQGKTWGSDVSIASGSSPSLAHGQNTELLAYVSGGHACIKRKLGDGAWSAAIAPDDALTVDSVSVAYLGGERNNAWVLFAHETSGAIRRLISTDNGRTWAIAE